MWATSWWAGSSGASRGRLIGDDLAWQGRVGQDYSLEEAQACARQVALNIMAQLDDACGSDMDRVVEVVRLGGFVNAVEGFTDHSRVMNGASELFSEVLGERGRHTRFAVGSSSIALRPRRRNRGGGAHPVGSKSVPPIAIRCRAGGTEFTARARGLGLSGKHRISFHAGRPRMRRRSSRSRSSRWHFASTAPTLGTSRTLAGILCIEAGTVLFAVQDGFMKALLGDFTVWMLIVVRAIFTCALLVPAILVLGPPHRLLTPLWALHTARAALFAAGFSLFYAAFPFMGLAELTTIFFSAPLFTALLAALVAGRDGGGPGVSPACSSDSPGSSWQ